MALSRSDRVDRPAAADAPFDPPYVLGGRLVVVLGLLKEARPIALPSPLARYRPVRLFGRALAVVVVSAYDDPPKEMPVRYHEAITACVVRRGLRLVVLPLTMQLDADLPVYFGHRYYGLPKTLDGSLRVEIDQRRVAVRAAGLALDARRRGPILQALLTPARWCFALGTRLFTSQVEIVGDDPPPARAVIVGLRPRGGGAALASEPFEVPAGELTPLFAEVFDACRTWLGPPRPWRDAGRGRSTTSADDDTRTDEGASS